ncbi:MAG: O-antigen/teichoic acid export membrane protein [Gammaproteobacteria bacterium]|jgi:O-antigen/teichoic acid export membrane protein
MKKKNPFQFLFLVGEGITFAVSGAVIFILISRVSGPDLLGQYSLAFAWIMVFQAVGNFGIPEFLMREFGRFEDEENKYFNNGLILGLLSSVAAIPLMIGAVYISNYDSELKRALTFGAAVLVPYMVNMICRGGFMAHKRSELIFRVAFLETALVVSVNALLVLKGYGIVPLIQTIVLAKIGSSVISLYLFHRHIVPWRWQLDVSFCRTLLTPIFTFALSNILGLVSTRANIIMLSWLGDLSIVGIYAAASKLVEFTLICPSIFAQFMLPQIARTFAKSPNFELREYRKPFYFMFAASIALGLGLIYFAGPVIHLLFGSAFEGSVIVFRVLLVFFMVECLDTMLGVVLKAANRQKQDVRLYVVHPALNILLNVILIPAFGGTGAAVARLAGAFSSCALRYVYVARQLTQFGWLELMVKPLVICAVLLGSVFLLREQVHFIALGMMYLASSALLLYWAGNALERERIG